MRKALNIRDFTILLLVTLADNSKEIDLTNTERKIASIPADYKQRIENILCAENGWKERFSVLIDTQEYFDDHFFWEDKLAIQIKTVIQEMGKSFEYDFVGDRINIPFSQIEIDTILSNYKNKNIKDIMNHFAALLVDIIYSREFQEQFHDNTSRSVQYMKNLRKKAEESY